MSESKRHSNLNRANSNGESAPNAFELEPDIGLGFPNQSGERRSHNENYRREDGPMSFRQFLQNSVENANTCYPDLYNCSRRPNRPHEGVGAQSGSPDLPDFVQDHLAVEHLYFNNRSHPSTVNLPDFASFTPRNNGFCERSSNDTSDQNSLQRLSPAHQLPLDSSEHMHSSSNQILPFDLTTNANDISEAHSPSESNVSRIVARLPDFLSGTRRRDERHSSSSSNNNEIRSETPDTVLVLRQENNKLRDDLNILQAILMKKDDRIKELEDIVMALEISKMQMSTDANTQTLTRPVTDDELSNSNDGFESSKLGTSLKGSQSISAERISNSKLVNKIEVMTNKSEKLVRELLKVITDMRSDIDVNDSYCIPDE